MLFAYIDTEFAEDIEAAVSELGGSIVYQYDSEMDDDTVKSVLDNAARVAVDYLILNINVGPPGQSLVKGLQKYRVNRPHTRIIVLAPGKVPGDKIMSDLVAMGVWDILSSDGGLGWSQAIINAVNNPATYADAVRWNTVGGDGGGGGQAEKQKEKIVYETRPAGMVYIAVAGIAPGIGATHVSLIIAAYLARHKHNVAVIEACPNPGLSSMCAVMGAEQGKIEGCWRVENIDVYPVCNSPNINDNDFKIDYVNKLKKIKGRYDYLVLDLGCLNTEFAWDEILRATVSIVVSSGSPWRWTDLHLYTGQLYENENIYLLVNQPGDRFGKMFKRDLGISFFDMDYIPDPFNPGDTEKIFKLLSPVLPERKEKKSILSFLKKG